MVCCRLVIQRLTIASHGLRKRGGISFTSSSISPAVSPLVTIINSVKLGDIASVGTVVGVWGPGVVGVRRPDPTGILIGTILYVARYTPSHLGPLQIRVRA